MLIDLSQPSSITHYKSIRGPIADDALVYLGTGGAAPVFANGQFVTRGAHPGRWVHPAAPTAVTTAGAAGHFLAVSSSRRSKVPLGAVCVLTQHGYSTHLGVVASADQQVAGAGDGGYQWYRWVFVLAIRDDLKITPESRPAFFRGGSAYIAHDNCNFVNKDDFRRRVWQGFAVPLQKLLGGRPLIVPPAPQVQLAMPSTYP